MDAAAAESDVKLYKASSELLAEAQAKLHLLLSNPSGQPRRWVLHSKTSEVAQLLDTFQEWPQLLDPILAVLVAELATAFLNYTYESRDVYRDHHVAESTGSEPLPRAVCRLLYVLCKVRGYKVVLRLLNNEPRCLEILLVCFRLWNGEDAAVPAMSWQERYIMLLWLSHLMLAPFQLDSISGLVDNNTSSDHQLTSDTDLPAVASTLLNLAAQHLCLASKDREAASQLVVRLALRQDMQERQLPKQILRWCKTQLMSKEPSSGDLYRSVGVLTLMYGMLNSLTSTEAASYLFEAFSVVQYLASNPDDAPRQVRNSAPARKLLIKLIRSINLHILAFDQTSSADTDSVESMLEESIQILLDWLGDSDTPVRQASSKALGIIVLKLEPDMSAEVVEAVLGCLNENILLENRKTGELTPAADLFNVDVHAFKKNVNAVDPLKWHGAMLTLSHVLFRRSPPPSQLSIILEALIMGLQFEQRSNVGISLGVGVRDAACFGIWSLARKYSTKEIDAAILPSATSLVRRLSHEASTLQVVATELVLASCLDPSGNLRRGASAALQELIGRHPDTIIEGISIVQKVDYHDVARRSNAMTVVSLAASQLGSIYHQSLLFSLLDWRGCRAVDADSRRQAAQSVSKLYTQAGPMLRDAFLRELVLQIDYLAPANNGVNAASRHGLLSSLAAVIPVQQDCDEGSSTADTMSRYSSLSDFVGILSGRITSDVTSVLEATCGLITSLSNFPQLRHFLLEEDCVKQPVFEVLDLCTTASEDELLCGLVAGACVALATVSNTTYVSTWLDSWIPKVLPKHRSNDTCRGRIVSLSLTCRSLQHLGIRSEYCEKAANFLSDTVRSKLAIETRVSAMQGISILAQTTNIQFDILTILVPAINIALHDYTNDQRGDVGSWLRLCGIEAVNMLPWTDVSSQHEMLLLQAMVCLAAEKLAKVRFAAWNCLSTKFSGHASRIVTTAVFQYFSDVSTEAYFVNLLGLFETGGLREALLRGLVGTICNGAEDASLAASKALISNILHSQSQTTVLQQLVDFLLNMIEKNTMEEDREVVPLLETLCYISEQFPGTVEIMLGRRPDLFVTLEAIQTPVADIPRIQALIRLLGMLSTSSNAFSTSADKLTRKLLHKWPRVRQSAADAVFSLEPKSLDLSIDWTQPAMSNKPQVLAARKVLGVSGKK